MGQEKTESKKRIILIIGLIILLIIAFCGGMLFGRKSAEKRIQIGNFHLPKDLKEGESRELTEEELKQIKQNN